MINKLKTFEEARRKANSNDGGDMEWGQMQTNWRSVFFMSPGNISYTITNIDAFKKW